MHVTDIEVIPVSHRLPDGQSLGGARGFGRDRATALIRADTGTGEVGWGEAFAPGNVIAPVVDKFFRDDVVDMGPFDVRRLARESYTDPYHSGGSVFIQSTLSGIDVALWDLVGKATGKPVHRLLDGAPREALAAYASTTYFTEADHDVAAPIRDAVDESFLTAKIEIGTGTDSDVEQVRTTRQLLGDDARLMVDINGSYRPRQAIQTAKATEEFDITWMEEPVPPKNLSGCREIKHGVDVPLTAGRTHCGRFEFERLVGDRTVGVVQPNLGRCGGFSEAGHITDPVGTENMAVWPHVWNSAISLAAAVRFAASVLDYPHTRRVPNPMLVEFGRNENSLRDEILESPFDPAGDEVGVPQAPGLGVEINEDAVERYRADN